MLESGELDDLFDLLARYVRVRERATQTTLRTPDGELETAALRGLFHLMKQPMRSRELAASLNADPSTVSRHVSQLVGLGLVQRQADPDDGRATLLVITDTGRDRVQAMRAVRRKALTQAMDDWSDHELTTLVALFGRFVVAMESVLPPGERRSA